ncbi:hypothetical protein evm_014130 [Chilo suppressalis]|nr:hypothetical protein evm_014130 [Chilo suppressalis]
MHLRTSHDRALPWGELNRLAIAGTEILAMTAVLARASRSYCIGLHNAELEMKLAACYVDSAKEKVRKLIKEIDDGEFINLDHFKLKFQSWEGQGQWSPDVGGQRRTRDWDGPNCDGNSDGKLCGHPDLGANRATPPTYFRHHRPGPHYTSLHRHQTPPPLWQTLISPHPLPPGCYLQNQGSGRQCSIHVSSRRWKRRRRNSSAAATPQPQPPGTYGIASPRD